MTLGLPFTATSSWLAAVVLAAGLVSPAAAGAAEHVAGAISESRPFAGSLATITIRGASAEQAASALDAAFAAFARVDAVMNEWRRDSPLSQLNAAAGSGDFTTLPPDLCEVLRLALDGARRTGGRFDPSWAALRDVWRFDGSGRVPDAGTVAQRCALVAFEEVRVEREGGACRARLPRAGMALGLGGIAKGWAVDRAADALRSAGARDFVVQAGGDLYAGGRDGDRPWRIGIRDPRGAKDTAFAWVLASDRAVSTSGDYEHFFVERGRRWHHLLDPASCYPARASRSATIVARSAVEAEILSKAVFIAGGREGLELAAREGAAAVIVTARNGVLASPSLRGSLRWRAPSSGAGSRR
ncbi:MAG TPA: FAD:protein FMN transferase [Anaeromyxobacteraceae bacterium]|nr:FAD:protein FMN transferase [Anaeromyxobacteraceae bacterium]